MTDVRHLFMMTQRSILDGTSKIVYGHATANVMTDYWQAYCDDEHTVEIQRILQGSMMNTPSPTSRVTFLPGDGTEHRLEVAYIASGGVPQNAKGVCAFCEGDPCAETEQAPQRIKDYFTKNASWASSCPICDGRPS